MNQMLVLDKNKTGENLRRLIKDKGFTFERIAVYLDLSSPRVIYDWINGFKMPKLNHLVMISKLLNVKIEDILEIKDVF